MKRVNHTMRSLYPVPHTVCGLLLTACVVLLALSPARALAADQIKIFDTPSDTLNFSTLANKLGALANAIIPFLIGVAVVIAFWGIFKYITAADEAEKRAEGRKTVVWSIIALFIMLAFWGLVLMIKASLFESS